MVDLSYKLDRFGLCGSGVAGCIDLYEGFDGQ